MRAIFVIDANSEEIIFSKRFLTVESRLKKFFQTKETKTNDSVGTRYRELFEYAAVPDNGIFKLAFSREVIQ